MNSHIVSRLVVGRVTKVPEWHPEHDTFEEFPVHVWLVQHPTTAILVDTGIGQHNELINEWYGPEVVPISEALAEAGLGVDDIDAVVLTHLHFDHCGQAHAFRAPTYVQAAELKAAEAPGYTVPEWATIPPSRLRVVDGDVEIAPGVTVLSTPGHTPGHQSVVVADGASTIVIGGQCAFRGDELRTGVPSASNLHDETWRDAATSSLSRIFALKPDTVELSHCDAVHW